MVAALADKSLWRLRLDHRRVVFAERIAVGWRIRDIIEDKQGRLVLCAEEVNDPPTQLSIVFIEPAVSEPALMAGSGDSAQRGELLFSQCVGCHPADNPTTHAIGPNLAGLFDRQIAGAAGFGYSKSLKAIPGHWTEKKLDAFLANPQEFAPGTSMAIAGIADPAARTALIQYLKTRK
jgi:cytochrome c